MHHRIAGILTGAVALSLALSGTASADSVSADADVVVAGDQSLINLGTVAGGSSHQVEIAFDLLCTGTNHSPVNTTITLTPTATAPTGGTISATPATIGPVPPTWPAAGEPCIDDPTLRSSTPSMVTLKAPPAAGTNLVYRVTYAKAPTGGISGGTLAQIVLSVAANAAPELDLPGDATVEGNTDRWLDRGVHRHGDRRRGRPRTGGRLHAGARGAAGPRHHDYRVRGDRHGGRDRRRLVRHHRRRHVAAPTWAACPRRRRARPVRAAPRSPSRRRRLPTWSTRRPASAAYPPRDPRSPWARLRSPAPRPTRRATARAARSQWS